MCPRLHSCSKKQMKQPRIDCSWRRAPLPAAVALRALRPVVCHCSQGAITTVRDVSKWNMTGAAGSDLITTAAGPTSGSRFAPAPACAAIPPYPATSGTAARAAIPPGQVLCPLLRQLQHFHGQNFVLFFLWFVELKEQRHPAFTTV
jgi:hypothetical protein